MATASKPAAMSRGDIVSEVAAKTDLPQAKADQVVREYEAAIQRALVNGGEVRIQGFGTFKTSDRAARSARNPQTGGTVQIAARTVPRFTPSAALKTAVDGNKAKSAAKGGAKGAKASAPAAKAAAKPAAKASAPAAKSAAPAKAAAKPAAKPAAKGGKK